MLKNVKYLLITFSLVFSVITSTKAMYSNTTHIFGDMAIQEVRQSTSNGSLSSQVIEIHGVAKQATQNKAAVLGQVYWTINADMLPLSKNICLMTEMPTCQDLAKIDASSTDICHNFCAMYGPEFLAYDKNRNILYLKNQLGSWGTGGGALGIFKADIKTHQIDLMQVTGGPLSGILSPDGAYLSLNGENQLIVLDVLNNKIMNNYSISYNDKNNNIQQVYNVKWISNSIFTFTEGVFKDKFQSKPISSIQRAFDVQKNKIVDINRINISNVGSK